MPKSLFNSEYCEIFKSTYFVHETENNWKLFIRNFNFPLRSRIFQHQYQEQVKIFLFHDWSPLKFVFICNISLMWWEINSNPNCKYILDLTKRRSKVQEKNMSRDRASNFDQWKAFSKNHKPMRVWLWLAYKFVKNYCPLRLFSEFTQTQKTYPTFLDKIRIVNYL